MRCLQMGLGKTLTSIAVLWAFARKEACKSLIVCPCSLLANWTKEIKLWLGIKMNPLVVTSGMPYIHTYIHTYILPSPSHCNEHIDLISLAYLHSIRFDSIGPSAEVTINTFAISRVSRYPVLILSYEVRCHCIMSIALCIDDVI